VITPDHATTRGRSETSHLLDHLFIGRSQVEIILCIGELELVARCTRPMARPTMRLHRHRLLLAVSCAEAQRKFSINIRSQLSLMRLT